MRSVIGGVLVAVMSICIVTSFVYELSVDNEYDREIASFWSLSEKASTLPVKAAYLNQFVAAVDGAHLQGNNALFYKNPDNDITQNLVALHSLQTRMNEIQGMDVTSFQYQQAISQITAQEQGEATRMLSNIEGVWYLTYHPFLWEWVDLFRWLGMLGLLCVGGFLIIDDAY